MLSSSLKLALLALALLAAVPLLPAASWKPIDPAEFADTAPRVDPEAGAEILSREVTIKSTWDRGVESHHYVRVRVYSERGVDKMAKVTLPYQHGAHIFDIEARTVKPDGTVLEISPKDIYDQEVYKEGMIRKKTKSFSPLGLKPGVIVEYRYSTFSPDTYIQEMIATFRSFLPSRHVRYRVSLAPFNGFALNAVAFRLPNPNLKPDHEGFITVEGTNLSAWEDEPFQLPPLQSQSAVVFYHATREGGKTPEAYWKYASHELWKQTLAATKPHKTLKRAIDEIISPQDSAEIKLRKLHDYCRTRILNRNRPSSGFTPEEERKLPKNDSPVETFQRGNGTRDDINRLFAALVAAAGFDARLARANDRTRFVYMPQLMDPFIFTDLVVAVNLDGMWSYYDPGATYLPAGSLEWKHSETALLIGDEKEARIQDVESAPAEASVARKTAKLTLDENGTLEGQVTQTYTGYEEAFIKEYLNTTTDEESSKHLREETEKRLKLAEITELKVENAGSPAEPLTLTYHLRVPEFAQRTGSRLFFQPGVFRKGATSPFEAKERRGPILFHHRYKHIDEVSITLPEGFELEAANAPSELNLGAFGSYSTNVRYGRKSRTLYYKREFALQAMGIPTDRYPAVQEAFQIIQSRDDHVLTLKRQETDKATEVSSNKN